MTLEEFMQANGMKFYKPYKWDDDEFVEVEKGLSRYLLEKMWVSARAAPVPPQADAVARQEIIDAAIQFVNADTTPSPYLSREQAVLRGAARLYDAVRKHQALQPANAPRQGEGEGG